jgi:hypothetical protein
MKWIWGLVGAAVAYYLGTWAWGCGAVVLLLWDLAEADQGAASGTRVTAPVRGGR